jgi:hypothetical protein
LPGEHIERAVKDFATQLKYCSKDGDYRCFGEADSPGSRSDLSGTVASILDGSTTVEDVIRDNPSLHARAARTLDAAEEIASRKRKRTEATTIIWYWGPTGTGKSHAVHSRAPDAYVKPLGEKDLGWWDSYTGQEDVWFDDFRGQVPYAELLTLADRWPKSVSRRGRAPTPFLARRIWITSPYAPDGVYTKQVNKVDSIAQLERRISEQHNLTEKYVANTNNNFIDLSQV